MFVIHRSTIQHCKVMSCLLVANCPTCGQITADQQTGKLSPAGIFACRTFCLWSPALLVFELAISYIRRGLLCCCCFWDTDRLTHPPLTDPVCQVQLSKTNTRLTLCKSADEAAGHRLSSSSCGRADLVASKHHLQWGILMSDIRFFMSSLSRMSNWRCRSNPIYQLIPLNRGTSNHCQSFWTRKASNRLRIFWQLPSNHYCLILKSAIKPTMIFFVYFSFCNILPSYCFFYRFVWIPVWIHINVTVAELAAHFAPI